jgi:hypothetical protein
MPYTIAVILLVAWLLLDLARGAESPSLFEI